MRSRIVGSCASSLAEFCFHLIINYSLAVAIWIAAVTNEHGLAASLYDIARCNILLVSGALGLSSECVFLQNVLIIFALCH